MDNKGYIYMITCITNGKFYVGQTRKYYGKDNNMKFGIKGRYNKHIENANKNKTDCPKLNSAIRKYGKDDFIVGKIISCSLDELNYYEEYYIKVFDSIKNGYNCTSGGNGFNFTKEQKIIIGKKISDKAKERWADPEYKNKCSKNIRKGILATSKNYRKAHHLPSNIYEQKNKEGILVGYFVEIQVNKIRTAKCFASTQVTPEENLKKAKNYLQEILKSLEVKII